MEILAVLHFVVLAAFVGIASVFMLMALINYLRVRRALLTWRGGGQFWESPLGPALFTLVATAGLGIAWAQGADLPPSAYIGYPAGGAFWCIGAYLSRAVVITEYGIIHDVNRISQAVSWGQIVDYFVTPGDRQHRYVFLYQEGEEPGRQRLELRVPANASDAFQKIVNGKLDARFSFSAQVSHDRAIADE